MQLMITRKSRFVTRGMAALALLLGAQGCAVEPESTAATGVALVVAGERGEDGVRAWWRFEPEGVACIVRATSEVEAGAMPCPQAAEGSPSEGAGRPSEQHPPRVGSMGITTPLTGVSGALAPLDQKLLEAPDERGIRVVAGDHTDLSSIGIGNGGR